MATLRVDLTSKEASKIAKANRTIDRLKFLGGVFLALFVLVVALVFGYFFYLNSRSVTVDSRVQAVVAQIQEKAETELLYRRLADIVQETEMLIAERQYYAGVLLDVYALLPTSVFIEGVRFEGDFVIVDVRTVGVQDMARTLQVMENVDDVRFSSVDLESVRRTDNGNYFIRVRLGLESA